MKIASAQLEMSSTHFAYERHEVHERLQVWSGPRSEAGPGHVRLSPEGRQRAADASAVDTEDQTLPVDPMLAVLKAMLFRLFGIEVEVFDARELEAPPASDLPADLQATGADSNAGFGVDYQRHETRTEVEETRFSATGEVRTADGRSINFDLSLTMSRAFSERTDLSVRLGDAARKKDPLVINFAGTAAQLSDQTFRIDLDSDGKVDEAKFVAPGSGFLVLDRNANGRIERADELFGPTTGDGFAELAALDGDRNGWIDENDAAYAQLRVWSKDAGTDRLRSLKESGVGAIALARLATPFEIRDANNVTRGDVRTSGVYLSEEGRAGSIQQIDLRV
jgi:hypothetical protein